MGSKVRKGKKGGRISSWKSGGEFGWGIWGDRGGFIIFGSLWG